MELLRKIHYIIKREPFSLSDKVPEELPELDERIPVSEQLETDVIPSWPSSGCEGTE